ncbi:hypothetical protein CLV63_10998 [Murinocardiopsis flavida]|uniref:Uncharacterized protein n=1 Tax=Murinocardiopsis flavida TaxID=645275 RepID=A0A2P8DIP5_9ACTN|nr:hypothetical protein [Murinocardiopsis flavida]PSK97095.1 hypothetical protein CLV63_10998 [Murinocardiopsis flavida]
MFTRLVTDSRGRQSGLLAILLGLAASMLALTVHLLVGSLSGGSTGEPSDFGWFAYTPADVIVEGGGAAQTGVDEYTPEDSGNDSGNTAAPMVAVQGSGYGSGGSGLAVWAFGTALVLGWLYLRARANRSFDLRFIALALLLWSVCWPSSLLLPSWGQSGLLPSWLVVLVAVPLAMSVVRRDAAATAGPAPGPPPAPPSGGAPDGNGGTGGTGGGEDSSGDGATDEGGGPQQA